MPFKICNINKTDRISRSVLGALLIIAAFIGMSTRFYIILGLILIIEGIIGWCSIPYLMSKFKQN